jgi:hypothetical protein
VNIAVGELEGTYQWPSIAYALDILAWDLLNGVVVLFAALAFTLDKGDPIPADDERSAGDRGTSEMLFGDMPLCTDNRHWRVGHPGFSPTLSLLLVLIFRQTEPSP